MRAWAIASRSHSVRATLGAARERAYARIADLLGITQGLSIVDGFRAAIADCARKTCAPLDLCTNEKREKGFPYVKKVP